MADIKDNYLVKTPKEIPLEQLKQLLRIIWDGDLISKKDRDSLVDMGFVHRVNGGYQIISAKGIEYLHLNGLIHP